MQPWTIQGLRLHVSRANRLPAVVDRGGVVGADQATVWSMSGEKETVLASGNYMKAIAKHDNQTLRTLHYRSNRIHMDGKICGYGRLCRKSLHW